MRFVKPEIYIIGQSSINRAELRRYLISVEKQYPSPDSLGEGFDAWVLRHADVDDLTLLTEVMGRLCYRSWAPGSNPNVTRVREETGAYIRNLIDVNHGSVFEHAIIHFIFENVSRIFTHELVRHRVGTAMSQESMRYVRMDNIPFWMPGILDGHVAEEEVGYLGEISEAFIRSQVNRFGLDEPGASFADKKKITSALRRLAPGGHATSIGWSCNVRELRHVIKMRTSPEAEEEMQLVFSEVLTLVNERWPMLFSDL